MSSIAFDCFYEPGMASGRLLLCTPGASEARQIDERSMRALQLGLEHVFIVGYQFGVAALLCQHTS
jgi:hypothetical protein